MSIGILEIVALANDPTVYERIADLSAKLVDLSPQIDDLILTLEEQHLAKRVALLDNVPPPAAYTASRRQAEPVTVSDR
ncbi:MAG: hypothetical protein HKN47_28405 [Pirellulaceae bacterium]|nr:hypothetical protein [Pirellulaceae bacterium]